MVSRGLHAYYSVHFAKKKRDQLVSAGFATELSVANDATEKNLQAQLDVVSWPCFIYIFKCALKPWACTCHTPLWQQWMDWSHFAYSCTQWQSLLDQKHRKNQNKSPTSAGPIQPPPTSVSSSVPPILSLASSLPVQSAYASPSVGLPIQSSHSLLSYVTQFQKTDLMATTWCFELWALNRQKFKIWYSDKIELSSPA